MTADPLILPTDLRDYAKSRGWQQDPAGAQHRLYVLVNQRFSPRQLVFPMDLTVPDYAEATARTVAKLAAMEERSITEVRQAVLGAGSDTLSFRVTTELSDATSLPLTFAGTLVTAVQQLLLASACSVLKPQAHHPRLSRAEAKQVVSAARFGQTRPGSFILNVSCPIDQVEVQTTPLPDQMEMPFVRRTTATLMQSLRVLVQAIEQDSMALVTNSAAPALSANFCEALASFDESTLSNSLEIDISWAARLAPAPQDAALSKVRIQRDYFRQIEQIGRHLRAGSQHQDGKFVGTVEGLEGEMGSDGHRSGDVLLSILTEDGERVEARASLNVEQHAKAYEAYRSKRGFVQITGRLHPGRQPRRLTDLSNFDLVQR